MTILAEPPLKGALMGTAAPPCPRFHQALVSCWPLSLPEGCPLPAAHWAAGHFPGKHLAILSRGWWTAVLLLFHFISPSLSSPWRWKIYAACASVAAEATTSLVTKYGWTQHCCSEVCEPTGCTPKAPQPCTPRGPSLMGGVALGVHEGDCIPVYLRQTEPLLLRITTT